MNIFRPQKLDTEMKVPVLHIFLFFLLTATKSFSQKQEHYTQFNGNKVFVVFLGKPEFDSALRKACADNWKATPIAGFITKDKVDDLIDDQSNSFLIPKEWDYEIRSSMNSLRRTAGLFLINGGMKKLSKYYYMHHQVGRVDFDLYGYEYNIINAKYRLPLVVADLSESVQRDVNKDISPKQLKNKILLINKNLVERTGKLRPSILKEALAVYKYKYEIVDEDRIESLINARDSTYALLVTVLHDQASGAYIHDLGNYRRLWLYGRKKVILRWPWLREDVFEQLNNEIR